MAEINARNKALIEGHTICNICFELYDAEACGKRAPITSPCCGQSACRQCVDKFHAVKQEAASRVKYFPCLFCNTEKAFHIDKLPTPHYGFIALISMCRQLQSDNSQQLAILDEKLAKMIAEASKSAAEKNIAEETAAELKEKLSARERLLIQQSEMHVRSLEDARSEIDGLKTEISSVEGRLRASEQDNDCLKLKLVELGTKSQITQDHSIASVHSVSQESAELSRCHSKEIPSLTLTQPEELGLVQTTLKEPISPSPPSHLIEDPTLSPGNSLKKSAKDEACVPFTTCKKNDKTKKTSKRAVVRSETSFLLDFETIPAEKFFAFSHPTNSVCLSDLVKLRPEDIFIASSNSEHKSNCHTVYLRSANSECIIGEYENIDGDDLGSGERLSKRACLEVTDARSLAQCSEPTTIPNSEPAREELQVNFREFTLNLSRLMRMLREVCADKLEEIYDLHFAGKFAPFSSYRRPGEALESLLQRFVENGNCRLETWNSTLILVSTTNDLDVEGMSKGKGQVQLLGARAKGLTQASDRAVQRPSVPKTSRNWRRSEKRRAARSVTDATTTKDDPKKSPKVNSAPLNEVAHYAAAGGGGGGRTGGSGGGGARNVAKPATAARSDVKCYKCNKYGHIAVDCPSNEVKPKGSAVNKPQASSSKEEEFGCKSAPLGACGSRGRRCRSKRL